MGAVRRPGMGIMGEDISGTGVDVEDSLMGLGMEEGRRDGYQLRRSRLLVRDTHWLGEWIHPL
jgi:hypothetical protein